jgi:hypothetical protein
MVKIPTLREAFVSGAGSMVKIPTLDGQLRWEAYTQATHIIEENNKSDRMFVDVDAKISDMNPAGLFVEAWVFVTWEEMGYVLDSD